MKRARFTAPARREFLAEVAYYTAQEPALGARFTAAVEAATGRALAFPYSGAPGSKSTRRMFVRAFPFALVYRPDADGILIFAVAHHSRWPEYWHFRVQEAIPVYSVQPSAVIAPQLPSMVLQAAATASISSFHLVSSS